MLKDRRFWEALITVAQGHWKDLESRIQKLDAHREKEAAGYRRPYQNRPLVQRLESKIAYLSRTKATWAKKIAFYQSRILFLEKRTRYVRMMRSPII